MKHNFKKIIALSIVAISAMSVQAQVSDIVLVCKVNMNKTLLGEKHKQRTEEITLEIKEYTLSKGNILTIQSNDSTWAISYTTTPTESVQTVGWKFQQKVTSFDGKQLDRTFYLNRYNGELLLNDISEDYKFLVKGNCRKQEAKF